MSFRWTDNEIDNRLFAEFSKDNPDENVVRDLVKQGANMNAIDCKGDSVLIDAISNVQNGLDIKFIQIIVDLGADLNYADNGFNCLFDACLTQNFKLVELLLKAGANPNCISTDTAESLLDSVEFDQWFEENECKGGGAELGKIVQLLKDYGAKNVSEIFTDKLENYLTAFATYEPTGLFTANGYIKIESIPNTDKKFIEEFKNWVANNPDKWSEYEYSKSDAKIKNPPDLTILRQHNEQGLQYAKHIKGLVGNNIEVKYMFAEPNDFEKYEVRNIEHLIIE